MSKEKRLLHHSCSGSFQILSTFVKICMVYLLLNFIICSPLKRYTWTKSKLDTKYTKIPSGKNSLRHEGSRSHTLRVYSPETTLVQFCLARQFTLLLAKVNTLCDYGFLEQSSSLWKQIALKQECKPKDNTVLLSNTEAFQLLLPKQVRTGDRNSSKKKNLWILRHPAANF